MRIPGPVYPAIRSGSLTFTALFLVPSAQAAPTQDVEAAFVVIGPGGEAVARAITTSDSCPAIEIDGVPRAMALRAAPGTEPLRPTASRPDLTKPSAFPARVCDTAVPAGTRSAAIAGQPLPLPKPEAKRIVVIGDTGCRLKAADDAWQACNDPAAWPFARIAAEAAAWKPDLVIHVGDYLYRENPCPEGNAGCAGTAWGYGWEAWDADFFAPGRKLLAAAPWVTVRGNHENCARGGQGWWRLVDPRPLVPGRDCNDPANDVAGDWSPAYAVPLGEGAQVVVMDLSHAGTQPLDPGDPRLAQFAATWGALDAYARGATFTFATDHYPFFGVGGAMKHGKPELFGGNPALAGAFGALDPKILPDGVDALLAGHIHLWQQVDLGGRQPSQFISGMAGTQEDTVPLPKTLPADVRPAPGTPIARFDAIVDKFGFMTLERTGPRQWRAEVHGLDGRIERRCTIDGRRSACQPG